MTSILADNSSIPFQSQIFLEKTLHQMGLNSSAQPTRGGLQQLTLRFDPS